MIRYVRCFTFVLATESQDQSEASPPSRPLSLSCLFYGLFLNVLSMLLNHRHRPATLHTDEQNTYSTHTQQQHALPVTAQTNRLVQDPTCLQSPWRRRQIEPCSGLRDSTDDARAPHSAQRHPAERLMRSSSKHYSILAALCLNTLIWAWNGKAHCDRYEDTDAVTSLAWVWLCCVWTLKPSHVLSGRRDVMPGLV